MSSLLEAKGLTKHYKTSYGKLDVLKGIDLSIEEGDITYIVGRSGSGKSTLLHILGALDHGSGGTLQIDGVDVGRLSDDKKSQLRNTKIGFVFQFYYLLPELTLFENVLLPAMTGDVKNLKEKAFDLLKQVGLNDREKHFPHQLSGGELQRGALVRALINDPKIVFCDEPTGNLDEENQGVVMELIERLNQENNQTFCIVTHDESMIQKQKLVYQLTGGYLEKR